MGFRFQLLHILRKVKLLQKARYIHDMRKQAILLYPVIWNFMRENFVGLPAMLHDLKNIFYNSGVCEDEMSAS